MIWQLYILLNHEKVHLRYVELTFLNVYKRTERNDGIFSYYTKGNKKYVFQIRAGKEYLKNSGYVSVLGLEVISLFSFPSLYCDNTYAVSIKKIITTKFEKDHTF